MADTPDTSDAVTEHLRRARRWAWSVFDQRAPGAARDLAWALVALTRDFDPDTYSPWLAVEDLDPARLAEALNLAAEIAHAIRKADVLQPYLVREKEAGR